MDLQYLEMFLSNIDDFTAYAIFNKDGNFVLSGHDNDNTKLVFDQLTFETMHESLTKSIGSKILIFKLNLKGQIFQCIRSGRDGIVGNTENGEVLVMQKFSNVSVIFIGKRNNDSYLLHVTRAVGFYEQLNNGNIDNLNIGINTNIISNRLQG